MMAVSSAMLAVAAAWKMQERMRKSNYPFKLRIGISTGVATTGIIGAKRQSFTAFGDTVNLASRIEGMCEPGAVTVDEATYKECSDIFEFRPVSGLASYTQFENATVVDEINTLMTEIEANPRDVNLRISIAKLLRQANDPEQAHLQLKAAMSMEPENSDVKVAYAENAVVLEQQRDLYKYLHDQTVRMFNAGMTPAEIAEQLELPESLRRSFASRGYYGTTRHNARAVYQFYLGWYDGNPANLNPLPPEPSGERYVEYMGGADELLRRARESFDACVEAFPQDAMVIAQSMAFYDTIGEPDRATARNTETSSQTSLCLSIIGIPITIYGHFLTSSEMPHPC